MSEWNLFAEYGFADDEPETTSETPKKNPRAGRPQASKGAAQVNPAPAQQPTVSPLKLFLLDRYCYRDKRVKKPTSTEMIQIDDRNDRDAPCLFCYISATFPDPASATFQLKFDQAPYSREVQRLVEERGGTLTINDLRATIIFSLTDSRKDVAWLRKLARAFRRIVGHSREEDYRDDNWRWVAPRTAKALRNLAQVLSDYTPRPPQPVAPPAKKAAPPAKKAKPPAIPPEDDLFQILATS